MRREKVLRSLSGNTPAKSLDDGAVPIENYDA
jgi:hypothetical protein